MEKTIFDNKPGLKRLIEKFFIFGRNGQIIGESNFGECCAILTRNNFAGHQFIQESFETQIWGTPEEVAPDWDGGVELRPINHIEDDGESWFERSLDKVESFWWSVYLHSPSKGWQCIADFWDKKSANIFIEILKGFKKPDYKHDIVYAWLYKGWFGAHKDETIDKVFYNINDIWISCPDASSSDVVEIKAIRTDEELTHRFGVDKLEDDDVFLIIGLEGRYKKVIE